MQLGDYDSNSAVQRINSDTLLEDHTGKREALLLIDEEIKKEKVERQKLEQKARKVEEQNKQLRTLLNFLMNTQL